MTNVLRKKNDFRLIVEKSWVSFIKHGKPACRLEEGVSPRGKMLNSQNQVNVK